MRLVRLHVVILPIITAILGKVSSFSTPIKVTNVSTVTLLVKIIQSYVSMFQAISSELWLISTGRNAIRGISIGIPPYLSTSLKRILLPFFLLEQELFYPAKAMVLSLTFELPFNPFNQVFCSFFN